jgi:hypothetical protein
MNKNLVTETYDELLVNAERDIMAIKILFQKKIFILRILCTIQYAFMQHRPLKNF